MRDDGPKIDEDPTAVGVALGPCDWEASFLGLLDDGVGDRARLDLRAARRDDEGVGDDRAAFEWQDDDVVGFAVGGRVQDDFEQIRQRRFSRASEPRARREFGVRPRGRVS